MTAAPSGMASFGERRVHLVGDWWYFPDLGCSFRDGAPEELIRLRRNAVRARAHASRQEGGEKLRRAEANERFEWNRFEDQLLSAETHAGKLLMSGSGLDAGF